MEWVLVGAVTLFFVGLIIFGLKPRTPAAPAANLESQNTSFAQIEQFPWGQAWVYDNDRERKSAKVPVVFIHGLGGSIFSWRYQLAEFEKTHPVIAMDLLGFGKSSKPLEQPYDLDGHTQRLIDILDSKNISSCFLVGCSLGGALALWLTSQHPKRFCKTLVISPAAVSEVAPFPLVAYDSLAVAGQRLISRPIIRRALQGGLAHHHQITDEIVESYLGPFRDPNSMACFFKTIATLKDVRIYRSLSHITTPVLILRGHADRVINDRVIQKIKKSNPYFESDTHPLGGHHLMEDEPDWVNKKIGMFFDIKVANNSSTEA